MLTRRGFVSGVAATAAAAPARDRIVLDARPLFKDFVEVVRGLAPGR